MNRTILLTAVLCLAVDSAFAAHKLPSTVRVLHADNAGLLVGKRIF